ncbi:MAG: hypothetical protein NW215_09190 [Hyphomicrobiales bacterium]|nr:hypothetical protein [Hyphomicrobiales bacterium]
MIPSLVGAAIALLILLAARGAGHRIIFGLFVSLAFGSTAIASLPALGGSTPLIYTAFACALIVCEALRRDFLRSLGVIVKVHWTAGVAAFLAVYAVVSAIIFPRLFAGEVTVFIVVDGAVKDALLYPTGGNITQTGYFVLGVLTFFALRIALLRPQLIETARRGFLAFIVLHVAFGVADLGGKVLGLGDVLFFTRSVNYALLTSDEVGSFHRIVGGYPEASTFSAYSLACIAFTYAYWRATGSLLAFLLTGALFLLLVFSTSTTAYVGLAALCMLAAITIGVTIFSGRVKREDLILFVVILASAVALLAAYLAQEKMFEPIVELVRVMVFEKSNSESGRERGMWNLTSVEAFFKTEGVGIGFGSSRSSSWIISVFAQIGVIGGLLMLALVAALCRGTAGWPLEDRQMRGLADGARAMAVGNLIAVSISGGSADPGILFFISLAVVLTCRAQAQLAGMRAAAPPRRPGSIPTLPEDAVLN